MRGRNRSKGPNPLTRTYESNGPDVKIRGTAQHIADKYAQLARDATVSGDPVSAENYLQHAEHYYRMIAAAQEQFRQQFPNQARPFDEDGEDLDEESGAPGGYGYGTGERPQAAGGEDFGDGYPGQPYENRQAPERQHQGRFDRADRQDGRGQDNRGQDSRGHENRAQDNRGQDNRGYDRQSERRDRFDRNGERFDRGERRDDRFDRNGERFDRNARGPAGDRSMNGHPQSGDRFDRGDRQDGRDRGPRGDNGRRDYQRNDRPQSPGRGDAQRFGSQPVEDAQEAAGGLPAFLTTPVRAPISLAEGQAVDALPADPAPFDSDAELETGAPESIAESRPRRPRRPRRPEPTGALQFDTPLPEADKPAE